MWYALQNFKTRQEKIHLKRSNEQKYKHQRRRQWHLSTKPETHQHRKMEKYSSNREAQIHRTPPWSSQKSSTPINYFHIFIEVNKMAAPSTNPSYMTSILDNTHIILYYFILIRIFNKTWIYEFWNQNWSKKPPSL